eukprot:UN18202
MQRSASLFINIRLKCTFSKAYFFVSLTLNLHRNFCFRSRKHVLQVIKHHDGVHSHLQIIKVSLEYNCHIFLLL